MTDETEAERPCPSPERWLCPPRTPRRRGLDGEFGADRLPPPMVADEVDEADDGLKRCCDDGDGGGAREDVDESEREWFGPVDAGRAGMRKPSASTRSRDLASRPFQIVVAPETA